MNLHSKTCGVKCFRVLIREARRLKSAMRIIVNSGSCEDTQREDLQRLGVSRFLPKPVATSLLAITLQAWLGGRLEHVKTA